VLVLTRKSNQSIMIGDDIEITVLSVVGDKVRIGIEAPRDVAIFRREVYLEIQEEGGRRAAPGPPDAAERATPDSASPAAPDAGTQADGPGPPAAG